MRILAVIDETDVDNGTARDLIFKAVHIGSEVAAVSTGVGNYVPEGIGVRASFVLRQGEDPMSSLGLALSVVEAAKRFRAEQVWFPLSNRSGEVAPRVSVRLGGGCITDVTGMERDGDGPFFYRSALAGRVIQKIRAAGVGPVVLTLRGSAFFGAAYPDALGQPAPEVVELPVPEEGPRSVCVATLSDETPKTDISREKIVVACGRGVNGPDGVLLVKGFADAIGAGLGATRAVVDAGWMPRHTQIGQTGQIIQPDLYIAVGISGAVQHLAGVSDSKFNVAVNRDPEAPIFRIADYGIVGDLFETIPLLRHAMERRRSQHVWG